MCVCVGGGVGGLNETLNLACPEGVVQANCGSVMVWAVLLLEFNHH